jgi:hypothetical protein
MEQGKKCKENSSEIPAKLFGVEVGHTMGFKPNQPTPFLVWNGSQELLIQL